MTASAKNRDDFEIILIRHGESKQNTGELDSRDVGDCNIPLTDTGIEQARQVGSKLGKKLLLSALNYRSPYLRTRQTHNAILQGAGLTEPQVKDLRVFEDPRLREVDHGYEDVEAQQAKRSIHGYFFYQFDRGESPAQCFDRVSGFLESLFRQLERKQKKSTVIVSHSITIRIFVMRMLHLTVEDFDRMASPSHCDVVRLLPKNKIENPLFTSGQWGVEGLGLRQQD